jgi:hypothetical protein
MRWRVIVFSLLVLAGVGWGQVQYVPPAGGDGSLIIGIPNGAAGLDENGELLNPEVSTGSFIFNGAGPPSAGSCPHDKATYRDTTTPGDVYVCYGVGQNWHFDGANDDAVVQVAGNSGSPITTSGPTNISVVGVKGLSAAADNGAKSLTFTPATKAKEISLVDVAASDDNVPLGTFLQAATLLSVRCRCSDTSGTLPTFTLADGGGNAVTITGTNPTCTSYSAAVNSAAITAGNAFTAGEMLALSTTNTPTAGKTCLVTVEYELQ